MDVEAIAKARIMAIIPVTLFMILLDYIAERFADEPRQETGSIRRLNKSVSNRLFGDDSFQDIVREPWRCSGWQTCGKLPQ